MAFEVGESQQFQGAVAYPARRAGSW
jgi:hypothetical protein